MKKDIQNIKPSVLVADDAHFIRVMIRKLLEEKGYSVLDEASNGKEAVIKYFDLKPFLVIMDLDMPKMDGLKASETILNKDPAAKIFMLVHEEKPALFQKFSAIGVLGYLLKPFQPPALWEAIQPILTLKEEC